QPVFTVYRLKSPLKVQGMQQEVQSIDTILMMLAPDNVSNEVLEVLSFISSLLVQQSGAANLFANGSEYEIKQFLAFQLTQFIKQQHILEEGLGMNQDILQAENIELNVDFNNKEEAVIYVGNMLVNAGLVNKKYIDKMLERETVTSTYMGNALAIPHGTDDAKSEVLKTGIAVVTVPNGVDYGDGNIAKVLIGIAGQGDEHLEVLSNIAIVCSEEENVDQIVEATSPEEIIQLFNEVD